MNHTQNLGTQSLRTPPVFNNWDVVARAWYLLAPSGEIAKGQARSYELCGQRIVVFRGQDGRVRALDAYCPHMGADLGIGKVVGDTLQCFFHQWRFDGQGACVDIPCSPRTPASARTQAYATEEKYGFVWVWPEAEAPAGVPEYPELAGQDVWYEAGAPVYRPCHHHVCMINGIDAQHLRTVHGLAIEMELSIDEEAGGRIVDYTMGGAWSSATARERVAQRLLGPRYAYRMRYVDASVGLLTTMLDTRLLGSSVAAPPLRMIFAFTPIAPGKTRVQPIYVAPRKPGALSWLAAQALLKAQAWGAYLLRDEDGAIYDNIRFQTASLLPIDKAVARYVSYVNKLPLSRWSTTRAYPGLSQLGVRRGATPA